MREHFNMMAAYNAWANTQLYDAAASMTEEDLRRDTGVFFRSLHGTLNHLYVADTIWMSRFRGLPNPPWRLDHIAHEKLPDLRKRREALDRDIIGFTGALTDNLLQQEFTYFTITNPAKMNQMLAPALAHFFNHQTHHRGQCHAVLTSIGADAPSMDLLVYQRSTQKLTEGAS